MATEEATQPAVPAPAPAEQPAAPAQEQAVAVDAAKDKLAAAGGEVPEQKQGETDHDYEIRLSKLTRELRLARQELERNKIDRKQLEQMRQELEKAKNKRISKREFVELAKQLNEGKLQLEDDEWAALPPAVRERLERLEKSEQERERAAQEQAQQAQRAREEGIVAGRIKDLGNEHPLLAANPSAAAHVLDIWYEQFQMSGQKPDLDEIITQAHEAVAQNLVKALQSDSARQFLLGKHPELRALFGAQEVQAASPTSEQQGAVVANKRSDKVDAPPRSSGSSKSKHPLAQREAELDASRSAYEEYRRAVRGG